MTIDIEELKKLAENTTNVTQNTAWFQYGEYIEDAFDDEDCMFIERVSPQTVLALIRELEEARGGALVLAEKLCNEIAEKRRSQMGEDSRSIWSDATLDSIADGADECAEAIRAAREQNGQHESN